MVLEQKCDDYDHLVRLADSNVKLQDVSGSSINSASYDGAIIEIKEIALPQNKLYSVHSDGKVADISPP